MKNIADMKYETGAQQMRELMDKTRFDEMRSSIEQKITSIERKSKYFKIGKTGQTEEERFAGYKNSYDNIETLFKSSIRGAVDFAEGALIDEFIDYVKCKNKESGEPSVEDPMKEDSNEFLVYIVWKE